MKRIGVAVMLCGSMILHAQEASTTGVSDIRNWFNDPFFKLSQDISDCPTPLGPFTNRAEMEDDAHYRVERGTSCWLAHKCTKPNSYMYDAPIADAVHGHFQDQRALLHGTSIWITVQRRFIYADGCVPVSFDQSALQRQLEAIPDVEQVFVRVTTDWHAPLPYKPFPPSK